MIFEHAINVAVNSTAPLQEEKEKKTWSGKLKHLLIFIRTKKLTSARRLLLCISTLMVFVVDMWAWWWVGAPPFASYLQPNPYPAFPHFSNGTTMLYSLEDHDVYGPPRTSS
ncbi:hypothetical protein PRIPAC_96916 [Pristionchus pacificus]|uniref:Uncharacterized protein n=1 Tax=Pristionchus pacificus TaxID=54126 RepID=A0A2A6BJR9_PRIPA|nr:hypothetical protein PRIPAC_96916 [Pristionchus pacificus]|eukprot:PDM66164.1 hypothetical protein PRIPAC_45389 [Pristionchus pacificus]